MRSSIEKTKQLALIALSFRSILSLLDLNLTLTLAIKIIGSDKYNFSPTLLLSRIIRL